MDQIFGRWYTFLQRPDPYPGLVPDPVYLLFNRSGGSSIPSNPSTSVFAMNQGFLGVRSGRISVGDVVVLLYGFQSPVVLRTHNGAYLLRGFAFVNGIMNGELLTEVPHLELE